MVSPFDSDITGNVYADAEIAALFSDAAEIQAYLRVESALAKAQGELGIIPADTASSIAEQLSEIQIDPNSLAKRFADDGIVLPGLVAALRSQLSADVASYLHHGVTSQDVIDTGLVIRLQSISALLQSKLSQLTSQLVSLANEHRNTLCIARTRNQNAAPTVFGLKVVNWLEPLSRQQQRLSALLPRLLTVQLGGSVGTLSALGPEALNLRDKLASELGLGVADSPWHVQRDNIVEFGSWLATTAALVANIGQDMLLLAQSEVAEIRFSNGGKSSTLPNKSNPVVAEFLVAIGTHCQSLAATLNQSLIATNERDGVSMALEQLSLGPLSCAAGASLSLASNAIETIVVDSAAMMRNIAADQGRILAETATFELCKSMDRSNAAKLVAEACAASIDNSTHMIDELKQRVSAEIDWDALRDPANALGAAGQIIERVLNP